MAKGKQDVVNDETEDEEEEVVGSCDLPPRMGFKCYYNENSDIVIRQECPWQGNSHVILSGYEASKLVEVLQDLIPSASD